MTDLLTTICAGCGQPVERQDTVVSGRGATWHHRCAPIELRFPESRGTIHHQLHQMHLEAGAAGQPETYQCLCVVCRAIFVSTNKRAVVCKPCQQGTK